MSFRGLLASWPKSSLLHPQNLYDILGCTHTILTVKDRWHKATVVEVAEEFGWEDDPIEYTLWVEILREAQPESLVCCLNHGD
jgi:hypothetical protein